MSTHVFTTHESYYFPTLGIVDFVAGQVVDPVEAIKDPVVRENYLSSGSLVELSRNETNTPVEVAETAPEPVEMEAPEVVDEGVEVASPDEVAPVQARGRGRPKKS